jgi:pantetheine-phosphate adenylyltransferase
MTFKKAVIAGSFDPFTLGHKELVAAACEMFDHVTILVATNPTKAPMFNVSERLSMISLSLNPKLLDSKVSIDLLPEGQTVASYAKHRGISFFVRGIRNNVDFAYEQNLGLLNQRLNEDLKTIYLLPSRTMMDVSSTVVRELLMLEEWRDALAEDFVSPEITTMLWMKRISLTGSDE